MKNQFKYSESGRTMLEMLGVLGIMGIIMYGAIAGINYGMSTYKINQTYTEVQEAVQGIQDLYSWSRCYPSADFTTTVSENDIFAVDSSFGDIRIVEGYKSGCSAIGPNTNYSFRLVYQGVDEPSCNRLKEMDWGTVVMDANCSAGATVTVKFCPRMTQSQIDCQS